ncbi:MAG: hypothetical protein ABI999_01155 [Acidobacteriota bacterium]
MKIKSLLSLLMIAAFAGISAAQTVKITSKKVVYLRAKPMFSGKRSFSITYPKVGGLAPLLNKKIFSGKPTLRSKI